MRFFKIILQKNDLSTAYTDHDIIYSMKMLDL